MNTVIDSVQKRPRKRIPANTLRGLGVQRHPTYDDPAKRAAMVAEAAYFMAEQRGFEPGHELDDWLVAEDQIRARLALGATPQEQVRK